MAEASKTKAPARDDGVAILLPPARLDGEHRGDCQGKAGKLDRRWFCRGIMTAGTRDLVFDCNDAMCPAALLISVDELADQVESISL